MSIAPSSSHGALHRFQELSHLDPDAAFLSVDGQILTRSSFLEQVAQAAGAYSRLGIGENDVVAICSPNRLEWCVAFWGAVAIGAIPAPLDPATGIWEMRQLLPILRPRLAVSTTAFRGGDPSDRLRQAMPGLALVTLDGIRPNALAWEDLLSDAPVLRLDRAVGSNDILLYACTSGTTGNPKILAVPHLGFLKSQEDMAAHLGWTKSDKVLLGMPLFHQGGFGMGLQALVAGSSAMYVQAFDPTSFLDHLASTRATVAQLSPTLGKLVLSVPGFVDRNLSCWRMAYFAGEVLPDDLAARFWQDLSLRVVNVVGSSETGTMLAWDSLTDRGHSASDLAELPFTSARILSETGDPIPDGEAGVLWISTDALLARYEGNPALTESVLIERDGRRWFCTGDLAKRLANGRLRFLGRAKRVVKRGPNLVHPEEVEAFLLGHPSIAAVAVGKEPNEIFGECLVAWIQPAPGKTLARSDVVEFCRDQISAYKIPDRMQFVDILPTDVGKIQHIRLRETGNKP
ncbi:MAG: class I adenylate-forming enzyme family protein [Fibrobacterota bacterium]